MPAASGKTCFLVSVAALMLGSCSADERVANVPEAVAAPVQGQLRPLSEVLQFARSIVEGKVIGVELESDVDISEDGSSTQWVYEIEVLTEQNHVVELEIDAISGKLLEIDGAPWPPGIERPPE